MEKKNHQQTPAVATKSSNKPTRDPRTAEFIAHVHEFRNRIFWVALLFIVTSAFAYQVRDVLVHVVLSPLGDQKLIYLTPAGGFSFIFQITMYAGAVVTAPFLVFQLYKFVTPALPPRAQRHSAVVFLSALALMIAGVLFGYFVAVPAALHFLTTFAGGYVDASLTADSYLNFILGYVVGLGVLFLLPLLLIFWHWIKPLTPKGLLKSERFMIVFSMIAAAIITPTPDIVNQMLIAGPILVVYQVGVIAILVMIRGERKRLARASRRAARIPQTTRLSSRALPSLELPSLDDLAFRAAPAPQRRPVSAPIAQNKATSSPKAVAFAAPKTATPVAQKLVASPKPAEQPPLKPTVTVPQKPLRYTPTRPAVRMRPQTPSQVSAPIVRPAISLRPNRPSLTARPVSIDGFAISAG